MMARSFDPNEFQISANEIIPGVWVGNQAASQSQEFMTAKNIKLIVNATKHIPSAFLGSIHYVRVPVNDCQSDVPKMRYCMPLAVNIIHLARARGMNVLIHCHAGMQRSAILAAAYLIRAGIVKTPAEAVNMIITRRNIAFNEGASVNFEDALNSYHNARNFPMGKIL